MACSTPWLSRIRLISGGFTVPLASDRGVTARRLTLCESRVYQSGHPEVNGAVADHLFSHAKHALWQRSLSRRIERPGRVPPPRRRQAARGYTEERRIAVAIRVCVQNRPGSGQDFDSSNIGSEYPPAVCTGVYGLPALIRLYRVHIVLLADRHDSRNAEKSLE